MKVTPDRKVYVLGVTLCIALTICSRNFADRGGPHFNASVALGGIAYLLAIRELFATPTQAGAGPAEGHSRRDNVIRHNATRPDAR